MKKNQKKMKKWADRAPTNFLHKYYLLEAELNRVLGRSLEAIAQYDKAIELAKANEYINEEALANELTAKFYLSREKTKIAGLYMQEARYCYQKWGAVAKVKHLDETYPRLLDKIPEAIPSMNLTTDSSRWDVDWKTVTKTAEVISGEIVLDELIKKLMRIVLENAGAQSGCLILNRDDSLFVAATGTSGTESFDPANPPWQGGLLDPANPPWQGGLLDPANPPWQGGLLDPANPPYQGGLGGSSLVETRQLIPVETSGNLPLSVINYVARMREDVVLNDASVAGGFTTEPYIQLHQNKSILCTPILGQGKLIGILYLENNLTVGAFTPERTKLLKVLCSQGAIALENALLYEELENYAQSLLEERDRMAREIHDTLAQAFTGIIIQSGVAERVINKDFESAIAHIKTVRELATCGLSDARRSVEALRPKLLEDGDLCSALHRLAIQMSSNSDTRTILEVIGRAYPLAKEVENNLFRIAQEALKNAFKYANATVIRIDLVYETTQFVVRVKDNGQGFDRASIGNGFGLLGMKERAKRIGAKLAIESQPGQGTSVVASVRWGEKPGFCINV